ncbi:hypothetical protein ET445_06850 [Agromyces protaetiae]|uniref:LysR substrate-binding domain-containing protein n=1 Tax=Agromyces protaetiae TaxID=2509455 RepID=A0A4P6FRF1_9MICO|nr:LysR family transcriptional regulator substrate-binding protein [Agromyces protaetiae]QAY73108.1 hypothetical protein ET445_06850 [Agromyces protaetiae]
MTIELVAAGTGYAVVPHGVARLHHRKDVVAIPLADAPPTRIALVWFAARDDADIQEFVGVVRGRSARSSRGDGADASAAADAGKKPVKAGKPAAKSGAGRGASGRSSSQPGRGKTGSGKSGGGRRPGGKGKRR